MKDFTLHFLLERTKCFIVRKDVGKHVVCLDMYNIFLYISIYDIYVCFSFMGEGLKFLKLQLLAPFLSTSSHLQ